MCSLMAAAGLALSAAQSVLTFKAQEAQYNAQLAAFQANAKSAGDSYNNQSAQENLRVQQMQASSVEKKVDLHKEALRTAGTALASSEGGGLSEEMLLQDIERQRADYTDIVGYNLKNEIQQSQMNMRGLHAEATSRGQSGNPGAGPSLGLTMLTGMSGAAMEAFNELHIQKQKKHGDIKTPSTPVKFDPGYKGRANR